ncbi:MAG TPA: ACT domain-containing protein [Thermoplasmata archaeon]|nr:ACT domain-containing protein [Thermoplasmata archaeon]
MGLIELSLHLPNRPGQLAAVARLLAEHGINVASIHVDSTARRGDVRLVVSDPKGALPLLKKAHYVVRTHELIPVQLEDRAGSFLRVLDALGAAKINIEHVVLLVRREGTKTMVGLGLSDLPKARRVLRRSGFLPEGSEAALTNAELVAAAPAIPSESVGLML